MWSHELNYFHHKLSYILHKHTNNYKRDCDLLYHLSLNLDCLQVEGLVDLLQKDAGGPPGVLSPRSTSTR